MGPEQTLGDLALVFAVLFAAALLAGWLANSVVPFYIVAGVALQPVIRNPEQIELFAILGVALLLFVVGLEFSLDALLRGAGPLVEAGIWDLAVNAGLGVAAALLLGLPPLAAGALAAALWISSSVIVATTITTNRLAANAEAAPALGIVVFEDLVIAVFLAAFTGAASVGGAAAGPVALAVLRTALFVGVLLAVSRLFAGPLERLLERLDDERLVLFLFLWLVGVAAVAEGFTVSAPVGAFLAGVALAGTATKRRIERMMIPYLHLFTALFFVSFGLLIDVGALRAEWLVGLGLVGLALAGKLATGWIVGWRRGLRAATRLRLGLLLAPRGEFSIVVAGLAVAAGVPGSERLPALVAMVVLVLSVAGPLLVARADALLAPLARRGG